jgi:hypothetical protein
LRIPPASPSAFHLFLIGLTLQLLALVAAPPTVAQQDRAVGQVVERSGAVNVLRQGVARALAPGDAVLVADLVVTGAGSRVTIEFADRALLTVGPRTQVDISQYVVRPDEGLFRGVLSLISGIVRVAFFADDRDSALEVRTRTAVASVRSTEWIVDLTPAGTAVLAIDGQVAVRGLAGGEVVLGPGEGTDVAPGAAPTAPARWGAPRVQDVLGRTRAH